MISQIIANQFRTLLPVFTEYADIYDAFDEISRSKALKPIYEMISQNRYVDMNQNDEEAIFRSVHKILPDEDFLR